MHDHETSQFAGKEAETANQRTSAEILGSKDGEVVTF